MKHIYPILAAALIAANAQIAWAQQAPPRADTPPAEDGLTLSGSMRVRYEAIDGQPRAGFNISDELVNLRTIILAEYRKGDVRFGVELFDSRVWGDNAGTPVTTNEVNTLEPVQAYIAADFNNAFGRGTTLTLTAGRMALTPRRDGRADRGRRRQGAHGG